MSQQDPSPEHSIVELAMARAARKRATPDAASPAAAEDTASPPAEKTERSLGRRAYDQTLARRLNARQAAGGEDQAPSADASPTPDATPEHEAETAITNRSKPKCRFRIGSHFAAAAVGAALTWYAMDEPVRTPAPKPLAAATPEVAAVVTPEVASAPVAPVATPPAAAPEAVPVEEQVRDMLERWRQAWSDRAVDSYLGFYSEQFAPADGTTRSVWAEGRRKNLLGRSTIRIRIHDVTVVPQAHGQVKVTLLQDYDSGSYKEVRQPKTFLLSLEDKDWRIVGEWQGLR